MEAGGVMKVDMKTKLKKLISMAYTVLTCLLRAICLALILRICVSTEKILAGIYACIHLKNYVDSSIFFPWIAKENSLLILSYRHFLLLYVYVVSRFSEKKIIESSCKIRLTE